MSFGMLSGSGTPRWEIAVDTSNMLKKINEVYKTIMKLNWDINWTKIKEIKDVFHFLSAYNVQKEECSG